MIDYIVRIEQYQNKRFEFLTKNFSMYRCLRICTIATNSNITTNSIHLNVTNIVLLISKIDC